MDSPTQLAWTNPLEIRRGCHCCHRRRNSLLILLHESSAPNAKFAMAVTCPCSTAREAGKISIWLWGKGRHCSKARNSPNVERESDTRVAQKPLNIYHIWDLLFNLDTLFTMTFHGVCEFLFAFNKLYISLFPDLSLNRYLFGSYKFWCL